MSSASAVLAPDGTLGDGRSAAAESLRARLDDPQTAAALHDLLDNVELVATLVSMVDGLLRRGEELTDNLVSGLGELRTAASGAGVDPAAVTAVAGELAALLPAVRGSLAPLQQLLEGPALQPAGVDALHTVALALGEGVAEVRATPEEGGGFRAVLSGLRDADTARGLLTLLAVARSLGRRTRG